MLPSYCPYCESDPCLCLESYVNPAKVVPLTRGPTANFAEYYHNWEILRLWAMENELDEVLLFMKQLEEAPDDV